MTETERIRRVREMERRMHELSAAAEGLQTALAAYEAALPARRALEDYYESPLWQEDFAADEAGLLPADLCRGVLTEDALFDLLGDTDLLHGELTRVAREACARTKFIVRPVMTTKEAMLGVSAKKRAAQSLVCGILIGFICGFIGAGGGMMMLLILTSVLGYELKTAVGTSVFIMTFTALTGAMSHFAIGGAPDWTVLALCVVFTLLWARIAAVFANKAAPKALNRATGIVLVVLGIVVLGFNILT